MQIRKVVGRFIKSSSPLVSTLIVSDLANKREDYNNDDNDDDDVMKRFHNLPNKDCSQSSVSALLDRSRKIDPLARSVLSRGTLSAISLPFEACPTALISEF